MYNSQPNNGQAFPKLLQTLRVAAHQEVTKWILIALILCALDGINKQWDKTPILSFSLALFSSITAFIL